MQSFSYIFVKDNQKNDNLGIKIVIPKTLDALVAIIRKKLNNYKFKSLFSSSSKLIRSISDLVPGETIYISNIDPNDTKNQIKHSKITTGKDKVKSQKVKQENSSKSNTIDSKSLLERYKKSIEERKTSCIDEIRSNTKPVDKTVKNKTITAKNTYKKTKKSQLNINKENKISETKSQNDSDIIPNNASDHTQKIIDSPSNDQSNEIRTREVTFDIDTTVPSFSNINFDLSPINSTTRPSSLKSVESDNQEIASNSNSSFRYSNHSYLDLTSNKLDELLRLCPDVLEVLTDDDISITYDI